MTMVSRDHLAASTAFCVGAYATKKTVTIATTYGLNKAEIKEAVRSVTDTFKLILPLFL